MTISNPIPDNVRADRARQQDETMRNVYQQAQQAAAELEQLRASGIRTEIAWTDLERVPGSTFGDRLYRYRDDLYTDAVAEDFQLFTVKFSPEVFGQQHEAVDGRFRELTRDELADIHEAWDTDETRKKDTEQTDAVWAKTLRRAKRVAHVATVELPGAYGQPYEPTLSEVVDLTEATGATFTVRRGDTVIVTASDATSAAVKAKKRVKGDTQPARIDALASAYTTKVQRLVTLIDRLGSLGVHYARTRQVPNADVGDGPADQLSATGVWLP